MQERFRQEQCTWYKENSTFGGLIFKDRKCGRCPHRPTLFITWHNSWEYSKFTGTPWRIPRKSTWHFSQEAVISRTSVLRILHDEVKLFLYKIQILQRLPDQNKAEGETCYEDICQRFENDSGVLDLNNLNDADHCGLCGASATLPVSQNLAIKHWIVFLSVTLFLPKPLLHFCYVRRSDFVAKYASMIFIHCCVVNRPVGSISISQESPRHAVYTTWKIWKKIAKHNFKGTPNY